MLRQTLQLYRSSQTYTAHLQASLTSLTSAERSSHETDRQRLMRCISIMITLMLIRRCGCWRPRTTVEDKNPLNQEGVKQNCFLAGRSRVEHGMRRAPDSDFRESRSAKRLHLKIMGVVIRRERKMSMGSIVHTRSPCLLPMHSILA